MRYNESPSLFPVFLYLIPVYMVILYLDYAEIYKAPNGTIFFLSGIASWIYNYFIRPIGQKISINSTNLLGIIFTILGLALMEKSFNPPLPYFVIFLCFGVIAWIINCMILPRGQRSKLNSVNLLGNAFFILAFA